MRRRFLIIGIIVGMIISIVYIVWRAYDLSSDYNYATAKLDIKNGDLKFIHIGVPPITLKHKEIELVATRYGFKNVYIKKYTPQQTEKGIKHYNRLVENYLILRNGVNWKKYYEREIDSLKKKR